MNAYKSYKVGRDGVILGVFDEPELVYMIGCGKVVGTDDFWTEGMSSWAKVSSRGSWAISSASQGEISPRLSPPALPSTATSSPPRGSRDPRYVEHEIREALGEYGRANIRAKSEEANEQSSTRLTFFSVWWKTTFVIYLASACLGYLNSGEYGLGYALGGGLLISPISGLFFGGIIYFFSKK